MMTRPGAPAKMVRAAFVAVIACVLCFKHVADADEYPGQVQVPADGGAPAVAAAPTEVSALTSEASEIIEMQGTAPAETGTSASIVSRKDIEELPGGDAQSLTQIVLTQPGFAPDSFGPDGIFHIRGLEAGVLYMVDGIQLPSGVAGQFTDVLPTALIQRMNLVVGGMPVEYGPSTGGVFDITTRRGSDDPAGEAEIVYGTYDKVEPSAWYSQAYGKLNVFAAGTYLSTDRGLDPPAVSPILHDAEKAGNALARINYDVADNDRVEVLARYSEQHFEIPIDPTLLPLSDGPRSPDRYGNAPPQFVPYDANPTELERDFVVTAAYTHTYSNANLLVAPYFRYFYSDLECDPVNSLGATADPGSTCSNIDHELFHEGANVTYAWDATSQHWKTGIIVDDSQSRDDYTQFTRQDALPQGGPDPALTISGRDNVNIVSGGAFVQDEIHAGALTLLPGARADFQDAIFEGTSQPSLVLASPSVRVGATYTLSDAFTLHGFAGYLWLPPNTVDAAVAARLLVPGLEGQPIPIDLKAETDESVELGVRYTIPGRFDADLTGYGRLSQNTLDVTNVGSTNLVVDYNYDRGRAIGTELSTHATATPYVRGFANVSWNITQGQGINSEQYLFTPAQVAYTGWEILDHVQKWTVNAGVDLHDREDTHLAITFQYGSGLRTGPDNNETVPGHAVWDLTLRHRFEVPAPFELAVDVFNVFDAEYAIRIGNGFVGSAYGPLREVNLRLTIPFGPRANVASQSAY